MFAFVNQPPRWTSSILLLILSVSLLNFPSAVKANETPPTKPEIIFSEINWKGSANSISDEWIELYNTTDQDIILNQYQILGAGSKPLDFGSDTIYSIAAGGYFLISNFALGDKTDLMIEPDLVNSQLSLSNQSLDIRLIRKGYGHEMEVDNTHFKDKPLEPAKIDSDRQQKNYTYSLERDGNLEWHIPTVAKNLSSQNHIANPDKSTLQPEKYPTIELNTTFSSRITAGPFTPTYSSLLASNTTESGHIWSIAPQTCNKQNEFQTALQNTFELTPGTYCLQLTLITEYKTISRQHTVQKSLKVIPGEAELPKLKKKLIINEINPFHAEYVELYNQSDQVIDLSPVSISDLSGQTKTTRLPAGSTIAPSEFFSLDLKGKLNLNDNGDGLSISTPSESIDQVQYPSTKNKNLSYQYLEGSWSWEEPTKNKANIRTPKSNLTPKTIRSQPVAYYISKLRLNEVSSRGKEFVELYNSSPESLDLSGLILADKVGRARKYQLPIDFNLQPDSYTVLELKGKLSLNDATEELVLATSGGEIIDSIILPKALKDKSYQYFQRGWSWQIPTPGALNQETVEPSNCTHKLVLARTAKNTFYTPQGKLLIDSKYKLAPSTSSGPFWATVCNYRKLKSSYKVDSLVQNAGVVPNIKYYELSDDASLPKMDLTHFILNCTGRTKANIKRDGIVMRKVYGVKDGPTCNLKQASGYALALKTSKNTSLYFINEDADSINRTQQQELSSKNSKTSTSAYRLTSENNSSNWLQQLWKWMVDLTQQLSTKTK